MSPKTITSFALQCLLLALGLFLPAGTLRWPVGWIFLIMLDIFSFAVIRMISQSNPGLMDERARIRQEGRKRWDRYFSAVSGLVGLVWLVIMPLDAVRYQWSSMPLGLQVAGFAGVAFALTLIYLVFRENAYLSPAVRIQEDRDQQVISSGPCAHVRHPMYSGFLLLFPAAGLLLGSWLGVLVGLCWGLMFVLRAIPEENTLREGLPDYEEYTRQVKFRIIPRVW